MTLSVPAGRTPAPASPVQTEKSPSEALRLKGFPVRPRAPRAVSGEKTSCSRFFWYLASLRQCSSRNASKISSQ